MAGKPCASRLAVNFTLDVDIRLVSGPFQARSMSMDTMMRLKLRAKVSLTFNLARNARQSSLDLDRSKLDNIAMF